MACNDAIASDEKRWSPCVEVSAGSFGGAVSGGRSSRVDSASRCDESDTRDRGVATMPSRGRSASDLRDDLGCDAKVCDDMLNSQAYLTRPDCAGPTAVGETSTQPPPQKTRSRDAHRRHRSHPHTYTESGVTAAWKENTKGGRDDRGLGRVGVCGVRCTFSFSFFFLVCRPTGCSCSAEVVLLWLKTDLRGAQRGAVLGVTTRSTLNTKG